MNYKKAIEKKIVDNQLGLDFDVVFDTMEEMKNAGQPHNDYIELFYLYVLNLAGEIIYNFTDNEEIIELLGWLKVKKTNLSNNEVYYYRFETEEEYVKWMHYRKDLYKSLTDNKEIRILNFLEMSTFDFITDGISNCKYKIIKNKKQFNIQKTGLICAKTKDKFMKTLANYFKRGYIYKPFS